MSSLNTALSIASGSLQALQTQLSTSTSNVSNADVAGYTKKSANKTSLATRSEGAGVYVTSVTSNVDPWLLKSIYNATSTKGASSTLADYYEEVGSSLGALSSDSSSSGDNLSSELTSLAATLTKLAASPTSTALKTSTVQNVDQFATTLRTTSSAVQSMREEADTAIANAVDSVNSDLQAIDKLNKSIVRATAAGSSTATLEDQRANLVADLSSRIGVTSFTKNDGSLAIYTAGGTPLLDASVHALSFKHSGTIGAASTYAGGQLSGVYVDATLDANGDPVSGTGINLTSKIDTGSLSSLIAMRDSVLPGMQTQLDAIALSFKSALNASHNAGTGTTPPNKLTGSVTGLALGNTLTASGNLTVAVTSPSGTTFAAATIALPTAPATLQGLRDTINGDPALTGVVTASIDGSGRFVLTAANASNGVALSGGSVTALGGTSYSSGVNLSSALGLNDLVTGTGAGDIAVRSDILAKPTLLATETLSTTAAAMTAGGTIIVSSDAQIQSLANALDSSGVASSSANLISQVASDMTATKARASADETSLTTLTSSFSSKYGVNVDEETANIQALSQSYAASAQVVSTVKSMFENLLSAVK